MIARHVAAQLGPTDSLDNIRAASKVLGMEQPPTLLQIRWLRTRNRGMGACGAGLLISVCVLLAPVVLFVALELATRLWACASTS